MAESGQLERYMSKFDSVWLKNYEDRHKASRPVTEPPVCYEPVAAKAREEDYPGRVHVRITSYRRRLCDVDNLCTKFYVDCLRYARIIKDDSPKYITLTVSQEKVKTKGEERTEIEIL